MRVPVCNDLALLDVSAVLDSNRCTVRNLVALTLAAHLINDRDFTRTRYGNQVAFVVCNCLDVDELGNTPGANFDVADRG